MVKSPWSWWLPSFSFMLMTSCFINRPETLFTFPRAHRPSAGTVRSGTMCNYCYQEVHGLEFPMAPNRIGNKSNTTNGCTLSTCQLRFVCSSRRWGRSSPSSPVSTSDVLWSLLKEDISGIAPITWDMTGSDRIVPLTDFLGVQLRFQNNKHDRSKRRNNKESLQLFSKICIFKTCQ